MHTRTYFSILITLTILVSVGIAQLGPASTIAKDDTAAPSYPYFAIVTGENVNIRSGPGTNYYSCGKINKSDKVKIVSRQFMWARIVPPKGSFSWISKQYVTVDPSNMPDTAKLADVVLPAGTMAEKNGTLTNVERRVQRTRKAVSISRLQYLGCRMLSIRFRR